MEYLKSLVGQDHDTIVEAIKDLAENKERVIKQEKEINDLHLELEEHREEIHYLKNKLDQKYDTIEDLEYDLEQIEEKLKDAKKEANEKDDLLTYQKNVSKNKERMISDLNGMRLESEEKYSKLEHQINDQDKVIVELKDKLEEKNEFQYQHEEILKLIDDIKHLKDTNDEKEVQLEEFSKENELLKSKLNSIQIDQDSLSLRDELGFQLEEIFKCEECDKEFVSQVNLKVHTKSLHQAKTNALIMLNSMRRQVLQQKLDVTHKISSLREKEFLEQQTCKCTGWCAISHTKHSWKVTKSESILKMVQRMGLNLVV